MLPTTEDGGHDNPLPPPPPPPPSRSFKRKKQGNKAAWWKVQLFRGMINDVRRRAPFYASDWLDAWDYRVVPATVYMYFAKYVPFRPPALGWLI